MIKTIEVGPLEVNCYIIGSESTRAVFIIDPGDDVARILTVVREGNLSVEGIINTHGHVDHAGGVKHLQDELGAPYYIHRAEQPILDALPLQQEQFGLYLSGIPRPDHHLEHEQILSAGDIRLKVLHTPGHSPGGICLHTGDVLFTGDTLFAGSVGRCDLPGGDPEKLESSITRHILTLPDSTRVYPGHGPMTTIGRERRFNPFLQGFQVQPGY